MNIDRDWENWWEMTYLGSSVLIPTMEYVMTLFNKNRVKASLYKDSDNYKEYRTPTLQLPQPFGGKAYISLRCYKKGA